MKRKNSPEEFLPGQVIIAVHEYLKYIEDHCTNWDDVLFRGHSNETWNLTPKIARISRRNGLSLRTMEESMLSEFKRRSIPHLTFQPQTDWDWLALAQHNEMPTRLLDWTANPLVALWFVVKRPAEGNSRGTVWIFFRSDEDYVSFTDNESPFNVDRTKVFRPNHLNQQIVDQDGWFTIHKYMTAQQQFIPLQNNTTYKGRLSRVAIPHDAFASIRRELNRYGLNHASVFPNLVNLSRHIEWIHSPLKDELVGD